MNTFDQSLQMVSIPRTAQLRVEASHGTTVLPRLLGGVVVTLCAYGVYDATLAIAKVMQRTYPSTGVNALFDYPWWGIAHFLPGMVYLLLGPFQFWEWFRSRYRRLHRWFGWTTVAAGMMLALVGISFPFTMPQRPISEKVFFVTVFALFLVFLLRAFLLARRREFGLHRIWMIRMFAVGLAAITNRVLLPIFIVAFGVHDAPGFWELFVTAGWLAGVINLVVAEWWISRTRHRSAV